MSRRLRLAAIAVLAASLAPSALGAVSPARHQVTCLVILTAAAAGYDAAGRGGVGVDTGAHLIDRAATIYMNAGLDGRIAEDPRFAFDLGVEWQTGYALAAAGIPRAQALTNLLAAAHCGDSA